jgi:hypothetical protein
MIPGGYFLRDWFNSEKEFKLRRMIMKRLIAVLIPALMIMGSAYATGNVHPTKPDNTKIEIENDINTKQIQNVSLVGSGDSTSIAEGGDSSSVAYGGSSKSDASSNSGASANSTNISNYRTRTPPLDVFPPYLPYWNHGGWGTVKAYFSNGPNSDEQIYERAFDPENQDDMRDLRGVIEALSYDGPLDLLGGILNGVGVIFGGPDNYHHGRGFEISSSLVRSRRPQGKPLLVFIDTNVDTDLLRKAGYAYVGKVSLEGKVSRNWDQVYDAAVAETLPWDVDILLISGGMKGVTVGSNLSFPGAAGAYSQTNYSVSLFGSVSSGITEGKGKAIVSAEGYRFWPQAVKSRSIPQNFYDKIRAQVTQSQSGVKPIQPRQVTVGSATHLTPPAANQSVGIEISPELYDLAGFNQNQHVENLTVK